MTEPPRLVQCAFADPSYREAYHRELTNFHFEHCLGMVLRFNRFYDYRYRGAHGIKQMIRAGRSGRTTGKGFPGDCPGEGK
jgi:hypothetical protein